MWRGKLNRTALEKTFRRTESLRGLKRTAPVPSKALGRNEVGKALRRYMRDHAVAAVAEQALHRKLGILGPALGRRDVDDKMMQGPVAGFYIPDSKELYVISDYSFAVRLQMDMIGMLNGTDFGYDMILSHEITHALQDQHHNLMRLDDTGQRDNSDRSLAFVSLIESDANVIGYAYSHAMDPRGDIKRAVLLGYIRLNYYLNLPLVPLLAPGVPQFYRDVSFGNYVRGLPIVERALATGGWKNLDRIYREAMPQSTEQVMFPSKFSGPGCDPPVEIPDMATPTALSGWAHVWSSTFGALQIKHLVQTHGAWWWQGDALAGNWGGDRFSLWRGPSGVALIWRTVWDDEPTARKFARTWREQLAVRYADMTPLGDGRRWLVRPELPKPSGDKVRVNNAEHVVVQRRGRRVVVIEGVPPGRSASIAAQTWAALPPEAATKTSGRCPATELLARPQPTELPTPRLQDRLFLPHRTVFFSVYSGWTSHAPTHVPRPRTGPLRWAVRDGIVWGPSTGTFSFRTTSAPLQTSLSVSPSLSQFEVGASVALIPHDRFALLVETQSFRPYARAKWVYDADFLTAGFVFMPHDRLVVSASMLWLRETAALDPSAAADRPPRRLAFGSPLGISGNGLPLLEWRLHDAAWLFWDPLLLLGRDGGIEAHSHRFGIGLYL